MPEIPDGAIVPADHKAKKSKAARDAAKAEAAGQPITFIYQDVRYDIDRENANDLELTEFAEDGKYLSAIRGYLGRDQWSKWKDANRDDKGRVDATHFEPFLNAVMEAIGGNSSASSDS